MGFLDGEFQRVPARVLAHRTAEKSAPGFDIGGIKRIGFGAHLKIDRIEPGIFGHVEQRAELVFLRIGSQSGAAWPANIEDSGNPDTPHLALMRDFYTLNRRWAGCIRVDSVLVCRIIRVVLRLVCVLIWRVRVGLLIARIGILARVLLTVVGAKKVLVVCTTRSKKKGEYEQGCGESCHGRLPEER